MTIPTVLVIVALLLALVDEFRARGQSLTGWAVVFICAALLWGRIT
jgi:drug/metabolite transporter superfamily protein YnfA